MDSKTFFGNFETIANAPGGIAHLRELILDLAVRGKLVDQEMLEDRPDFDEVDGLFEVADNWIWTSIDKIGIVNPRNSREEDLDSGFVPMTHVQTSISVTHGFEVRKWGSIKKGYTHLADGDVAVAKITPCFENGKSCVIQNLPNGIGAGTTELLVVRPNGVLPEYVLIYLKSPLFRENGIPRMTGTAGQKRLPTVYFKTFPLPLPPRAEQERIATKVDELMAICDELETTQDQLISIRTAARKSASDSISTASTPDELKISWNRIHNNWAAYCDDSNGVEMLRALVLELANRGQLSTQKADEGKPNFVESPGPFEIPVNWTWTRLDQIATYNGRPNVKPTAITPMDWVLDLEDIEKGTSRLLTRVIAKDRKTTSNKSTFQPGDVLYGKLRPYLDKVLVADHPGCCTTEIVPIVPKNGIDSDWLRISLKSPQFLKYVNMRTYGTKMPRLGTKDAECSLHPVPPLLEQQRIVNRVQELMTLCDEIKGSLSRRQDFAERLAKGISKLVTNGA